MISEKKKHWKEMRYVFRENSTLVLKLQKYQVSPLVVDLLLSNIQIGSMFIIFSSMFLIAMDYSCEQQ